MSINNSSPEPHIDVTSLRQFYTELKKLGKDVSDIKQITYNDKESKRSKAAKTDHTKLWAGDRVHFRSEKIKREATADRNILAQEIRTIKSAPISKETPKDSKEISVSPANKQRETAQMQNSEKLSTETDIISITNPKDQAFLASLKELKIDGIDLSSSKIDQEKLQTFFLNLTPTQVYNFRNKIDPVRKRKNKYETKNFRKLMGISKLNRIKIPSVEIKKCISEILKKNKSVIPLSELNKIGYSNQEDFFKKITEKESHFRPFAISSTGALGIAQHTDYRMKNFNPFDWKLSIEGKIKQIQADFKYFGDIKKTIVAYNRGRGYVKKMVRENGNKWYATMKYSKYGKEGYNYLKKITTAVA